MIRLSVRIRRGQTFHPETLEGRNLLSPLAPAKPIPAKPIPAVVHPASPPVPPPAPPLMPRPAPPLMPPPAPPLVPLNGSLQGTAVVNGNPFMAPALVTINGQGNISHLGKSTIQASHYGFVDSHLIEHITDGNATITAANGDKLFLTYNGTGSSNKTTGFNDTYNFQITGGTGRFTGATGNGTIHAFDAPNAQFPIFPFTGDIEGAISTVGSNKKG